MLASAYLVLYIVAGVLMTLGCIVPAVLIAVLGSLIAWRFEAAWAAKKSARGVKKVAMAVPRPTMKTAPASEARTVVVHAER